MVLTWGSAAEEEGLVGLTWGSAAKEEGLVGPPEIWAIGRTGRTGKERCKTEDDRKEEETD